MSSPFSASTSSIAALRTEPYVLALCGRPVGGLHPLDPARAAPGSDSRSACQDRRTRWSSCASRARYAPSSRRTCRSSRSRSVSTRLPRKRRSASAWSVARERSSRQPSRASSTARSSPAHASAAAASDASRHERHGKPRGLPPTTQATISGPRCLQRSRFVARPRVNVPSVYPHAARGSTRAAAATINGASRPTPLGRRLISWPAESNPGRSTDLLRLRRVQRDDDRPRLPSRRHV